MNHGLTFKTNYTIDMDNEVCSARDHNMYGIRTQQASSLPHSRGQRYPHASFTLFLVLKLILRKTTTTRLQLNNSHQAQEIQSKPASVTINGINSTSHKPRSIYPGRTVSQVLQKAILTFKPND